jgi:hypothetical protein
MTLPDAFDDEYFRHMQWAHFASGAAGGGMRWPNREPHSLTPGMRQAQQALAGFLPLIDWTRFQRRNLHGSVAIDGDRVAVFACGDAEQALLWLLRTDALGADGRIDRTHSAVDLRVSVPDLRPGDYQITYWDTEHGFGARHRRPRQRQRRRVELHAATDRGRYSDCDSSEVGFRGQKLVYENLASVTGLSSSATTGRNGIVKLSRFGRDEVATGSASCDSGRAAPLRSRV